MEDWHYIVVLVLFVLVIWILNIKWKRDRITDPALDGKIEHEAPNLDLSWLRSSSNDSFADTQISNFDINDTNGFNNIWNSNRGVGSGEAPQLTEVSVESPEYKRQMQTLIKHMAAVGYKKKIVNDYVTHIKENHLSPQLILMQMKNDPNAPPPNLSEDPLTN
jgi:hypothetical protein